MTAILPNRLTTIIASALLLGVLFAFGTVSGVEAKATKYQKLLKAEEKKCNKQPKKKRAACKTKAFYGFGLKAKDIPSKHGTLVWSRQWKGKSRPEASRTDIVIYSSRSLSGKKIVVSGTVMIPKTPAPAGGYPVISWAHGTTGLADQCAPSRLLAQRDYYGSDGGELIGRWLAAGYAVLATDYEGLGTPGIHPYLIGDSEGRGVLDIVPAARQLQKNLSSRVALTGHSQGGQAILFAANLATTKWGAGAEYLGTVAYAPASNLDAQANNLNSDAFKGQYGISSLALSIVRGMTLANSAIDVNSLLTPKARSLYKKTTSLCSDVLRRQVEKAGVSPADLLVPNWNAKPAGELLINELKKQNPAVTVGAPVLIPQGEADTTVFPTLTNLLVNQLRTKNPGADIAYEVFPGADHGTILLDSYGQVESFIDGLFAP